MSFEKPNLPVLRRQSATAKTACVSICTLINGLPSDQANRIQAVIGDVQANLKIQLESHAKPAFVWDKLPGEIKNAIYKLLFVSDRVIEPHVSWPYFPAKRVWTKHNLTAQILMSNKAIYEEALPLLLGANTFELNNSLEKYFGYGLDDTVGRLPGDARTLPIERAAMVQSVVLRNPYHLSTTQALTLRRLHGLKKLVLLDINRYLRPMPEINTTDWKQVCADKIRLMTDYRLLMFLGSFDQDCYFIAFEQFYNTKKVRIPTKSGWVAVNRQQFAGQCITLAFKWKLKLTDRTQRSYELNLISERRFSSRPGMSSMEVLKEF